MNAVKTWINTELQQKPSIFSKAIVEAACTCFFVFIGLGANSSKILTRQYMGIDVQLAWASGIGMGVLMGSRVSGPHINPAVSFMFLVQKKMSLSHCLVYCFAQTFGAFIAAAMIFGIYYDALNAFDGGIRTIHGANATGLMFSSFPQDYLSLTNGLFDQVANTAVLCIGVKALTDKKADIHILLHPFIIITFIFLIVSSLSLNAGSSINPARDFGPRLFMLLAGYDWEVFSYNNYKWWWVPIVGPMTGGVVGGIWYDLCIGYHMPDLSIRNINRTRTFIEPIFEVQPDDEEADYSDNNTVDDKIST
uniref:Aquaporin-9 n=1 Tax=Panagrellus redivivus TaxID=6233 RepID=A0A7E4V769_PANRE